VDLAGPNHVFGDHEIANLPLHREVIHHFQHEVFEDHAQAPRANFALESQLGDGVEGVVRKSEADILKFEQPLVLLQQRVLGLGENANQRGLVQVVHHTCNGQTANKLGYQSVTNQIARLHLFQQFGVALLRSGSDRVGVEAESSASSSLLDDLF